MGKKYVIYVLFFGLLFMIGICKVDNYKYKEINNVSKYSYKLVDDISYEESIEEINTNPERGFYRTAFLNMKESDNEATNSGANLVHLRVNIGSFSKANNGVSDKEISEDALQALDQTLKNIKNNGGSVIIRFAYDGFNGHANVEPNMEMILRHIEQVGKIIAQNKEVITYVECGFFGPWGEMHSSSISSLENVSKAIDKWLDVLPEEIKIGVRTPRYYAAWAGVELDNIDTHVTSEGTREYRVGLFNDGYLGSESDLGTYSNREKAIKWLEKQATHTFYGGEVVANYATGEPLNTPLYMSEEGFKTHTTYLNKEWNNQVIDGWKNIKFEGKDLLYKGQSGYLYVNNHLGYRYVLKSSYIDDEIYVNGNLKIKVAIDNVGFANMINEKKTTLVLDNGENIYELDTLVDVREWLSKETSEVEINVILPSEIVEGEWNVYLRISSEGDLENDNNYQVVQLANVDIWNEEIGANYIGKINVAKGKEYTINYYLDNKKMDSFTKIITGNLDKIINDNKKEIDSYLFREVQVNDDEIDYYYESIVKNPNTVDKFIISVVITFVLFFIIYLLKNLKVKK